MADERAGSVLTSAREALRNGNEHEALAGLDRAGRLGKKESNVEVLQAVAALAEDLARQTSGSLEKRASRMAYAARQNARQVDRRAAAGVAAPTSRPGWLEWLGIAAWVGALVVVGILAGDAYAQQLVTEDFSGVDFAIGFGLIPLALGLPAGFAFRAHGSFIDVMLLAAGGAVALGAVMSMQLDLSPGSEACPSGCEEDSGFGGVASIAIVFLPLLAGVVGGRFLRRAFAR
jgi:hypothetical protein